MKRCIKWVTNWFAQWVGKMCWQEKVSFALGGVLGIIVGITIFVTTDTIPATPLDYQPLEEQAIAVQQNPKLLLETNCNIDIDDEAITICFKNDECKINARYNKSFEMLSYSKEDNCKFWVWTFCGALLIGIATYGLGTFVIWLILDIFTGELRKE